VKPAADSVAELMRGTLRMSVLAALIAINTGRQCAPVLVWKRSATQVRCHPSSTGIGSSMNVLPQSDSLSGGQCGSVVDSHHQPVFHVLYPARLFGRPLDLDPETAPMIFFLKVISF